jgi:c-di-GMP-binding flagellar brake protein YcgR
MAETGQHERRKDRRVPFIKEIEVIGVGIHRSADISIGGLYLDTHHVFPLGSQIGIRFKLNDADEQVIQVQTRVLYIHQSVGIGLGFVDIKPDDLARIVKFVEQR